MKWRRKHQCERESSHAGEEIDNAEPYTDEPLADELWIIEYEKRQEQKKRQLEQLSNRLDRTEPISSW